MEPEPDSPAYSFLPVILLLLSPSLETLLGILGIIFLLACSALISGSEVAFFSLTPNDFERLEQENGKNSQRILALKDKPRRLLATILISNNFINIAIVILSEFVLMRIIPPDTFEQWAAHITNLWGQPEPSRVAYWSWLISFLITIVGVTFLLVLFGEVAPKVYAKINNLRLAKVMARPITFLLNLLGPLNNALVNTTRIIERRLATTAPGGSLASREDIDEAIELTVSQEKDAAQDVDILKSIVKFGEVTVKQIMSSRVDVVAVDFRIDYHELLKVVQESGYSRIPVYENDFDNVTGILYVKDLLGHLNEGNDFEWQQLIHTDVYYVPEAKKINDLLKEFQKEHLHLAIVVDEYGGSSGIVTLEDIMEEIIGEIKDEFDDELEVVFKKIDDYNYLFEGKTLLNDVCRIVGIDTNTFDEAKGEADSMAGLILELTGVIPKPDTEIPYNQFRFKIVSVSRRRIEQILFMLPKP
ncbi:MAG: gliding motility-associated protein GldE [Lewinellaceae bacterium]|nr:gliding motility-associated protein GldE [Lewinellaceae bacterium]